MTLSWQSWLPAEALGRERVERLLRAPIAEWGAKWFAQGAPVASELAGRDAGRALQWRGADEGVAFGISAGAEVKLARLMLDAEGEGDELTPRDGQVIEQLAAGCLNDLTARLTRAFGLPADARWRPLAVAPDLVDPRSFAIGFGADEPLVELLIETGLIAAALKAQLGPVPATTELEPIDRGLARQPVSLAALLGRCELSLADLSELAPGDVLVLGRGLDEPLELAIDGRPKHGRCAVEQADGRLALKILEPLTE